MWGGIPMGDGALPLPGHYWRCPNQYDSHTCIMLYVLCIGAKSAVKSRTKSRDIYATTLYQSMGQSMKGTSVVICLCLRDAHGYRPRDLIMSGVSKRQLLDTNTGECSRGMPELCAVVIMFYRDKRLPICIPQMLTHYGSTYERAVGEARPHVWATDGKMKAMSAVCTYYRKRRRLNIL